MQFVINIRAGWVSIYKIAESMKRGCKHVSVIALQHTDSDVARILKEKTRLVKPNILLSDITPL